ncbi:MAG: PAS domain-containing protein [Planctomycetes bacterium]|nr:PAS domain-containing protein [Planctomycetota bacterium]
MRTVEVLRVDGLTALDAALLHATGADEVAQRVAAEARAALAGHAGFVWLLDARRTHLVLEGLAQAPETLSADYLRRFTAIPLGADLPAAWSVRTGEALWFESRADVLARFPAMLAALGEREFSGGCVPLGDRDAPVGAVAVRLTAPQRFDPAARDLLERLAHVAARALERVRLRPALGEGGLWWEEAEADGCRVWSGGPVLGHPALVEPAPRAWWRERLHPDDAGPTLASLEAFRAAGEEEWTARYRLRRADGDFVLVEDRARALRRNGAARRIVGALIERPSPGAAGDLRALLDGLPGAIAWERDAGTLRLTYASQAAAELLGPRAEDDPCWLDHVDPADRERVAASLRAHGEGDLELEYRARGARGRALWLRDRVQRVSEGPARWLRGLTVDATAYKALEEQRARAARRVALLADAGRALGGSLDRDEMLGALARLLVPGLADGCAIHLVEPAGPRLLVAAGADVADEDRAAEALRAGRALVFEDPTGAARLWAPLAARGRPLGVLGLLRVAGGWPAEDVTVAEELGARAGLALDHAALFRAHAEERARLEAVLAQLPAGVVVVDAHGTLRAFNAEAERIVGRELADARTPDDYYQGLRGFALDGRELARDEWPLARAVRGEVVPDHELDFVAADGARRPLRARAAPVTDREGRQVAAVVVFTDESAAAAARRALEESNRTLEALVAASPLATALLDAAGRTWLWNPAAERMFGWAAGEVLGRTLPIVRPDDCAAMRDALGHVLAGTPLLELQARGRCRGGPELELCAWAAPVPGPDGAPRCLALFADVSHARALERELLSNAHELDDRDRRKDEFLAMLGHELRNPIAAISATVALLGRVDPLGERQARAVLGRQARHMARLVDDLLDVARITRGTISLRREAVALDAAVDGALAGVAALVAERAHEVVVEVEAPVPVVLADPTRLEQVLVNLLTNAARYTPAGGRIEVAARRRGEEVEVVVRDTGVGIPADLLPRLFQPFTQGPRGSAPRGQEGLGLGLSVVRRLVELHGGRVEARSPGPGGGTELVFWLPHAEVRAASAVAPPRRAPPRRRLLLVDDNQDVAAALAVILADDGHEVRVVHDGEAALRALDEAPAEVALLDIGLPGMDGLELARRIRARPGGGAVLLVALTGYGGAASRAQALAAGFDHHLLKPLDVAELEALLA